MRDNTHAHRRRRSSGVIIGLVALAALAGFLILRGHGYHLLAYSPLLILLACPFLHSFMHRGHGGHGDHGGSQPKERADSANPTGTWAP